MSGLDALQSVQFETIQGKRFAVMSADDWETLVEWLETLDGIDYALTNSLSLQRAVADPNNLDPETDHVVPYLADFCFGTKQNPVTGTPQNPSRDSLVSDERTGWLQDPRPRPLYSTNVDIANVSESQADYLREDQRPYLRTVYYPALTQAPQSNEPKYTMYQAFTLTEWQLLALPDLVRIPFSFLYQP